MKQFVLLLPHAPDRYHNQPEEDFMDIMKDYIAWVQKMTEEGIYTGGQKLVDAPGKTLVATPDGADLHDGPYTELAEVLGGIMVINANNIDDAVRIARTNPHLKHNRRIEIREIHPD